MVGRQYRLLVIETLNYSVDYESIIQGTYSWYFPILIVTVMVIGFGTQTILVYKKKNVQFAHSVLVSAIGYF